MGKPLGPIEVRARDFWAESQLCDNHLLVEDMIVFGIHYHCRSNWYTPTCAVCSMIIYLQPRPLTEFSTAAFG